MPCSHYSAAPKVSCKIGKLSTKQSTISSKTNSFLMKFNRTELKIGLSEAKNCEESAGDVRFGVGLPKLEKNSEKHCMFHNFCIFWFLGVFWAPSVVQSSNFDDAQISISWMFCFTRKCSNIAKKQKIFANIANNFANIFCTTFGDGVGVNLWGDIPYWGGIMTLRPTRPWPPLPPVVWYRWSKWKHFDQ